MAKLYIKKGKEKNWNDVLKCVLQEREEREGPLLTYLLQHDPRMPICS